MTTNSTAAPPPRGTPLAVAASETTGATQRGPAAHAKDAHDDVFDQHFEAVAPKGKGGDGLHGAYATPRGKAGAPHAEDVHDDFADLAQPMTPKGKGGDGLHGAYATPRGAAGFDHAKDHPDFSGAFETHPGVNGGHTGLHGIWVSKGESPLIGHPRGDRRSRDRGART